jgi:hypothetical protein
MSGGGPRWKDLSEQQRWRVSKALEAGDPVDEEVAPAVLELQRSNKRGSVHLAWIGPLIAAPIGALVVGLVMTREREQGVVSFAFEAMPVALPLTAVAFAAVAFWMYSRSDDHERRIRVQLGEPMPPRSARARAGRGVGRAVMALLMGLVLTPLVLFPARLLAYLVSLIGVPVDAIPDQVGVALGLFAVLIVAVCSHRWLRTHPSSPLRLEDHGGDSEPNLAGTDRSTSLDGDAQEGVQ